MCFYLPGAFFFLFLLLLPSFLPSFLHLSHVPPTRNAAHIPLFFPFFSLSSLIHFLFNFSQPHSIHPLFPLSSLPSFSLSTQPTSFPFLLTFQSPYFSHNHPFLIFSFPFSHYFFPIPSSTSYITTHKPIYPLYLPP